ncbi:MAG: TRAP transporter large permease [Rhodospirillaceae bacterium]|nr:TRAP transporter large permease [Rhodospirillaceae bacterium]
MEPTTIGLLALAGILIMIALHVPIGVAMALCGFAGTAAMIGVGPALDILGIDPAQQLASEELAVIAMFLLMGNFASAAGLSSDLYRLAQAFLGHRRGGLAAATVATCAGFGAVCGSSVATVGTMARIALPEMKSRGYATSLATGSIASGATLGIIVPPSVIMVLYAILTEQFITALFVAAVVPALLATLLYIGAVFAAVAIDPAAGPAGPRQPWGARFTALKDSWGVVALAVIVSGGIYSGVFTVHEAAAVGAAASVLFALLRGRLTRASFFKNLLETASSTALIYLIIIGANVFGYCITLSHIPDVIITAVEALPIPDLAIIYLILAMYVVLGAIFDEVAAMVITLPFVLPLVVSMGYDPIWWGVVNVVVIEIGMIMPPIGINVFVMQGMAPGTSLATIYRGVTPFVIADILRLIVLVAFPALTLWLPKAVGLM